MWSNRISLTVVVLFAISTFVATSYVYPQTVAPSLDKIVATCRSGEVAFVPLTSEDLKEARDELQDTVRRLDVRLKAAGANGENWRKYVKWEDLQQQLALKPPIQLKTLDAVHARFATKYDGLGLIWFDDVREALGQYLTIARAIDNPDVKPGYEKLLSTLADHLEAYAKRPMAEEAMLIGQAINWLEELHQADEIVAAIRSRCCRPNLLIQLSDELVAAGMARTVDETEPVEDYILGTTIRGTGRTEGEVTVELFPDEEDAVVDTVFLGINRSDNVGYNGPVRIFSRGLTRIGARKRLLINDRGIEALPSVCRAITSSTVNCIRSRRGCRLVERAAWKRVWRSKSTAEWIASRHAEQRVNRRIDQQAEDLVARANQRFHKRFRHPLWERKLFLQRLRFSTTRESLCVTALRAGRSQLGAPGSPAPVTKKPDLGMQVHESMINNMAATALAGITLTEDRFAKLLEDITGSVPERLKPEEGKEPWAISFDEQQPLSVVFDEDGFAVTIRAWRYARADDTYPGMNVTAEYKIVKTAEGPKAVRQGELKIFPPGFVAGGGRRLSGREQTLRRLLERRFGRIFEEELIPKQMELPGEWSQAGKLALVQWNTKGGWLSLAWKRAADVKTVAAR